MKAEAFNAHESGSPAPPQPEAGANSPLLNRLSVGARLRVLIGLAAAAPAGLAAIHFTGGADAPLVMLAATVAIIAVVLIAGARLGRSIAEPVAAVSRAMTAAASGRPAAQMPALAHGDEIGEMARALNALGGSLKPEPPEPDDGTALEKATAFHDLAAVFEEAVDRSMSSLSGTAVALRDTAESMASVAAQAEDRASAMSAMSRETESGAQGAAVTAGRMTAAIGEIEKQVMHSATIAANAVQELHETNRIIATLAESAQEIGGVVELIHQIAGQTNLLALNATIEAARAGEAGKGFAVVAQEVKTLATQTAKATDGIAKQVEGIQSKSRGAAEAMENVRGVIAEIFDIATDIAGAVDEQGESSQEIARNIEQVSAGALQVTVNMTELSSSAEQGDRTSADLLAASETLEEQSRILREQVGKFLDAIRAA